MPLTFLYWQGKIKNSSSRNQTIRFRSKVVSIHHPMSSTSSQKPSISSRASDSRISKKKCCFNPGECKRVCRIANRISRPSLSTYPNAQSTDEYLADSCGRKNLRATKASRILSTISPPRGNINTTMSGSLILGAMTSPPVESIETGL